MLKALLAVASIATIAADPAMAASAKTLEGRIVRYECGDNCYLTVRDAAGKAHTGLCSAPQCAAWNEKAEMPKRFIGQSVRVTVGKGKQFDGEGNVMGTTDAYPKIEFLK